MFGLYIHIPYCRSKCRYCDFYSTPCPDGVPEAYIDALCREMDRFSPCGSTPLRPDTLYFGGGTVLNIKRFKYIFCIPNR